MLSCSSTYDGDTIYYTTQYQFKKMTYANGKFESSTWVDSDTLKSNNNLSLNNIYRDNISNLQYVDEYIYFNTNAIDMQIDSYDNAYRIGKISKDGKTIEMLSDKIHATNYTIYDGWVYYFDNGFNYSSNMADIHYMVDDNDFSKDRVGIYRAKIDGSNIEKLYGDFVLQDYYGDYVIITVFRDHELCTDMKIAGNYIYFIDRSKNGQGKVCRINMDGSNYQKVTDNIVSSFTINEKNNTLYYISNILPGKVYEKKIDDISRDKELMDCISFESWLQNASWLQYYDNYLYIFIHEGFNENITFQRYNFEKDEIEIIHDTQSQEDDFSQE